MGKAVMKPVPDGWVVAPYKGQHMIARVVEGANNKPMGLTPIKELNGTSSIKLFRYRWQAVEFIEAMESVKGVGVIHD